MTEYIVEFGYKPPNGVKEEVVRCRDCEHYDTEWASEAHPGRHWCDTFCHYTEPDGFCAWGDRRD